MLEAISTGLKAIKDAGPVVYTGLLAATSLLLFLPDTVDIGLTEIRQQYRSHIGLVFVGSASLLVGHGIAALGGPIKRRWRNWREDRGMFDLLAASTEDEKGMLRLYIVDGENTVEAPINDGVAQGLVCKKILYTPIRMTMPGRPGFLLAFNLQPFARRILEKHPALLE